MTKRLIASCDLAPNCWSHYEVTKLAASRQASTRSERQQVKLSCHLNHSHFAYRISLSQRLHLIKTPRAETPDHIVGACFAALSTSCKPSWALTRHHGLRASWRPKRSWWWRPRAGWKFRQSQRSTYVQLCAAASVSHDTVLDPWKGQTMSAS